MGRQIWATILAGSMIFAVTACGEKTSDVQQTVLVQEDEEEAYPTTTVEYGDVVKNVTIRCEYTSTEKQELAFTVDGELIERVEVKNGDYVSAGQLLVSLDVADLEDAIEEAEYQVRAQELKLKQTLEMKEFEIASAEVLFSYTKQSNKDKEELKEKIESIEAQYKTTIEDMQDKLSIQKQRLQQYRDDLEAGQLFADITGEITYLENGLVGGYTVKDRVVVTVSDMDACYFASDDIEYLQCFEEGESLTVNYRDGATKCTCEVVPALMDTWSEMMYFKPVGDDIIASKTQGTIIMELDRRTNVLCVPVDAIHEADNGLFVYLEKNGLLEMRYVTVGLEGDEYVEITDGLEQGEIIALKK